jgi:PDZ domain
MKDPTPSRHATALALCILTLALAGCSATKSKASAKPGAETHQQRGWIGGKFEAVGVTQHFLGLPLPPENPMPHGTIYTNGTGLLITALGTNTPAHQAGLGAGDLIVALNHQPITTLKAFRKQVDAAKPGSPLAVTAWHNGQTFDCNLVVGREVYHDGGTFGIWIPFYLINDFGRLDLWPNPGFSLGFVLGFEPDADKRVELNTPKGDYHREVTGKDFTGTDPDWHAWLVFFSLSRYKTIQAQEIVAATDSTSVPANPPAAK